MQRTSADSIQERITRLRICVVVPTYNNAATIAQVVVDIARFTRDLIVVNDGSTDPTESILRRFSWVHLIGYQKNRGKGHALRQAFDRAAAQGYAFAITLDGDGQHFAKDIPAFVEAVEKEDNAIFIGERDMDQANVPGKSSFGNKFSNFWFKVETGITLADTQSGYRIYPLLPLKDMKFVSRKYEFEVEVLVRAAWKGLHVRAVPVSVFYPPAAERVSHFRPFKDTLRISLLNTALVLITFFYIKPRDFFRLLSDRKKSKDFVARFLLQSSQPDHVKALSVAFGVFMGIVPIWGFQLITAVLLSILFKLNKMLVVLAAHVSFAPMIPLIIYLSYRAGAYWMGPRALHLALTSHIGLSTIRKNFEQYLFGSLTLALFAGLAAGLLTFGLLKWPKRKILPSTKMP